MKKSILKKKWYEEPAEYLELDPAIIKNLQRDPNAQKTWHQKFPPYKDTVNSPQRLIDRKAWIDQWRKNYGMIVSGDRIAFQRSMFSYKSLIKWLLHRLNQTATIIDYGCGTSVFCRLLSEYCPDAQYVLVDIDSPALRYSYERCRLFAKKLRTFLKIASMLAVRG